MPPKSARTTHAATWADGGQLASMQRLGTAQRLAGCSFGVGGVPFWGKLTAPMEQLETAHRLAGYSFGVSGVPFWGKLTAPMEQLETAHRLAGYSFGVSGVPFWGKLKALLTGHRLGFLRLVNH